jgi:aryl-alcohol dehydrogenase-like predicted oxidoreductase
MDQRTSETFALVREHGVAIVARSVLFKGILTDRGRDLHPALGAVNEHRNKYNEMLEETGWTLSDLAVKFALFFAEMSSVLVGIDRMDYLEKAVEVADGNYLNDSQMTKLKSLQYPEPDFLDLTDWRIKGWLKGI